MLRLKQPNLKKLKNSFKNILQWLRERPKRNKSDFNEIAHGVFNGVMPFVLVALVNNDLTFLAVMLVFLSKWRMVAMRINHLPASIRANLTDLIVKLSSLSFIVIADSLILQVIFASWYSVWLLLIKPQSGRSWVLFQAGVSQLLGITALMWASQQLHPALLLVGVWLVVYSTSYHFLSNFDEPMSRVVAKVWALLGVQLAWIFLHWNLKYFGLIPQYALLQLALSYIGADIYTVKSEGNLTPSRIRIYLMVAIIVALVMILSGDWVGPIIA